MFSLCSFKSTYEANHAVRDCGWLVAERKSATVFSGVTTVQLPVLQ